jgi:hypothetical protein
LTLNGLNQGLFDLSLFSTLFFHGNKQYDIT